MPMEKTSTLIYSIHNLASQSNHQIMDADDIDGKDEFGDIYELLDQVPTSDVRDEVIEEIMKYSDQAE